MPTLVGKEIGPIGYGLMGLTWRAEPCSEEQAFEAMKAALKNGMNFWNGGEFYGKPEYNSLVLLERYFAKYPEDADKVVLSIKGGMTADFRTDGSPENTRRSLDTCISQLKGRKKIDIFEFARRDPNVPLKTTFEVIEKEYIQTGKVGGISLSEVRAETIHEAVKLTKVVAVEVELSLFSREILENGVADACAQYNIPVVAYSPVSRGFLTGQFKSVEDVKKRSPQIAGFPIFQEGNFEINMQLVHQVEEIAAKKGVTPVQIAINWITRLPTWRKGTPKTIIPIPGTTTAARVTENATKVDITDDEMAQIDATLSKFKRAGGRYPAIFSTDT
ncbi:putative aldo/keto reductase [Hypoxylon sp. NC1633]|nr:putative aldo/keto reductase [Hypoxylon sp. NC1633]